MMILIADSGSTTTDWALIGEGNKRLIKSSGINPSLQDDAVIAHTLTQELRPLINNSQPTHIYFYGAGCVGGNTNVRIHKSLENCLGNAHIEVESDLLGAARSLCGHSEGIAGILGTGANSCHYDGKNITQNTPPLGYILGDEGSGTSIGKAFLRTLLRGDLGKEMIEEFYTYYNTDYHGIINSIYRQPAANRYLASLSPFIASHLDNEKVYHITRNAILEFMTQHIMRYNYQELPLHLTGSIAYYYRTVITEAAQSKGITIGNITQSPIEGLIDYHTT